MMFTIGILLGIIALLLMAGYVMFDTIEFERNQNDVYYQKLRKEYDIQVQQLKNDIEVRDEIIDSYRRSISHG